MSADEKEPYFDGPHMSSNDSSSSDKRQFNYGGPPMYNSNGSHASFQLFNPPCGPLPGGVVIHPPLPGGFGNQPSGSENLNELQDQSPEAAMFGTSSENPVSSHYSINEHQSPSVPPDVPTSNHILQSPFASNTFVPQQQPLPPSSNMPQMFLPNQLPENTADHVPTAENAGEASISGQPFGSYMNMANNGGQQFAPLPTHGEAMMPFQQAPSSPQQAADAGGAMIPPAHLLEHNENVSLPHMEFRIDQIHPDRFQRNFQSNEGGRHSAEDSLHSQGTWPTSNYASTSADHRVHHLVEPVGHASQVSEVEIPPLHPGNEEDQGRLDDPVNLEDGDLSNAIEDLTVQDYNEMSSSDYDEEEGEEDARNDFVETLKVVADEEEHPSPEQVISPADDAGEDEDQDGAGSHLHPPAVSGSTSSTSTLPSQMLEEESLSSLASSVFVADPSMASSIRLSSLVLPPGGSDPVPATSASDALLESTHHQEHSIQQSGDGVGVPPQDPFSSSHEPAAEQPPQVEHAIPPGEGHPNTAPVSSAENALPANAAPPLSGYIDPCSDAATNSAILDTHTMHSSYVSVQSSAGPVPHPPPTAAALASPLAPPIMHPSGHATPPTAPPPQREVTSSKQAPQSLRSQMVAPDTNRAEENPYFVPPQVSDVKKNDVANGQNSYNDMHATSSPAHEGPPPLQTNKNQQSLNHEAPPSVTANQTPSSNQYFQPKQEYMNPSASATVTSQSAFVASEQQNGNSINSRQQGSVYAPHEPPPSVDRQLEPQPRVAEHVTSQAPPAASNNATQAAYQQQQSQANQHLQPNQQQQQYWGRRYEDSRQSYPPDAYDHRYHQRWRDSRRYDSYYPDASYDGYGYQRGYGATDYDDYYRQRDSRDYYSRASRYGGQDGRYEYERHVARYRGQYENYYPQHNQTYAGRQHRYDDDDDRRSIHSEQSTHNDRSMAAENQRYYNNDPYGRSYHDMHRSYREDYDQTMHQEAHDPYKTQATPARKTPAKFSSHHPLARFGAGGQLVVVMPRQSVENQTSNVEIHSIETLLQNTPEAEKLQTFPGPLSKDHTHKNDVIRFITSQSRDCSHNTDLVDRQSAALMWEFLELLVRQNGSVLGTDIAELLMKGHSGDFALLASPDEAQNRPSPSADAVADAEDAAMVTPEHDASEYSHGRATHVCPSARFRELLLYGRKKDALEWAMKSNLWGHALLLASKTDTRTHATVMLRFANSLPINDPLQTLYQLMSGRQPASTTCVADEGWGDWRPHLAMILSNATSSISLDTRVVMTMGDTMMSRGLVDAAHFCYLMASNPLGYYTKKSSKLVLLGSSHTRPFKLFSVNEAIQRTETYEYAISLAGATHHPSQGSIHLPALQLYKFMYACRLLDYGMVAKAFHYCEDVANVVIHSPTAYSVALVSQLAAMVDRLKHHDNREQAGTLHDTDLQWTRSLSAICEKMLGGSIIPSTYSYTTRSTPASDITSSAAVTPHPHGDEEEDSDASDEEGRHEDDQRYYSQEWQQHGQPASHQQEAQQSTGTAPALAAMHYDVTHTPALQVDQQLSQASLPPMPGFYNPVSQQEQQLGQYQQQQTSQYQQQPGQYQQQQQPSQYQQQPGQYEQQQQPGQYTQQQQPGQYEQQHVGQQPYQPQQQYDPQTYHQPPAELSPTLSSSSQTFTSIPSRMANQPGSGQPDLYDHLSSLPADLRPGSRVRTTSQTSHGSRRSRRSRKSSSGRRTRNASEHSRRSRSRSTSAESEKNAKVEKKSAKRWSIMNWFGGGGKPKANKVHLPDDSDKDIQWDDKLKRWVDANATEEDLAPPPPPPMDASNPTSAPSQPGQGGVASEPSLTRNKFSLKNLNKGSMYKNAFSSTTNPATNSIIPQSLVPPPTQPTAPNMFVPSGGSNQPTPREEPVAGSERNQTTLQPNQEGATYPPAPTQPWDGQSTPASQPQTNPQQPPAQQNFSVPPQQYQHPSQPDHHQQQSMHPQTATSQVPTFPQGAHQPPQSNPPPPSSQPPPQQHPEFQPATTSPPVNEAPPAATFYNPAQFGGGSNLFSQPPLPQTGGRGGTRGRGRYPNAPSAR